MKKKNSMRRNILIALAIVIIAVSASYAFFSIKPKYNVVLIVVDTLRADHMGVYGYVNDTTPNIDEFANRSVVFENAITAASWTLPSFSSFLSSRHPSELFYSQGSDEVLYQDVENNVFKVLQNNGYNTAAFVTLAPLNIPGPDKGFYLYDEAGMSDPTWTRYMANGTAKELTRRVSDWLDANSKNRFFLMLQYGDVHCPETPPPEFNVYQPASGKNLSQYDCNYQFDNPNITITKDDIATIRAAYDGDILYTDYYIGKLLGKIKDLGLDDNTIVIIMADHGEELAEHYDYLSHTESPYQSVSHVPLIIRYPGSQAKRINTTVGLIDLSPTILDMLGIDQPEEFEGKSLLPVISGLETANRTELYTIGPRIDLSYRGFALIENSTKIIQYIDQPDIELYNLSSDPKETENLADSMPAQTADMRDKLLSLLSYYEEKNKQFKDLIMSKLGSNPSQDLKESLNSLGYIS